MDTSKKRPFGSHGVTVATPPQKSDPGSSGNGSWPGISKPGTKLTGSSDTVPEGYDSLSDYFQKWINNNSTPNDGPGFKLTDQHIQWMFDKIWSRETTDYNNEWSMYLQEFASKLGLTTANASRSQMFDQLVALGMSPSAAFQVISGSTASGSGAGGAGSALAPGAGFGGQTPADKLNAASNLVGTISDGITDMTKTVGDLVYQFKALDQQNNQFYDQLNQQNDHFYAQLNQNQSQFENSQALLKELESRRMDIQEQMNTWTQNYQTTMSAWPMAISNASVSPEMNKYQGALMNAITSENWSPSDQINSSARMKKLASAKPGTASAAAYAAWKEGQDKYGSAWEPAVDSVQEKYISTISEANNFALVEAQTRQSVTVSKLNGEVTRLQSSLADISEGTQSGLIDFTNAQNWKGLSELQLFCDMYEQLERQGTRGALLDRMTQNLLMNEDVQYFYNSVNHYCYTQQLDNPWMMNIRNFMQSLGFSTGDFIKGGAVLGGAAIR